MYILNPNSPLSSTGKLKKLWIPILKQIHYCYSVLTITELGLLSLQIIVTIIGQNNRIRRFILKSLISIIIQGYPDIIILWCCLPVFCNKTTNMIQTENTRISRNDNSNWKTRSCRIHRIAISLFRRWLY